MASESTIIYEWEISDCFDLIAAMESSARRAEVMLCEIPIIFRGDPLKRRITKARLLKLEHPERKPTYELELE